MNLKKIVLLLLTLMLLGGCGTSSQIPSGNVAASSKIHVPENLTQLDGAIATRSEISRDADIPADLVGAPGKIQIVVDGNEKVIEPGAAAYDEILGLLQARFPEKLQEAQQAVLWSDENGFNWKLMCEQFDFLLLSYDAPQSVYLNCLSTANPAVPQITFDQMLFPLTELHELVCVDTEETGSRCYGSLDKASAARLREYADPPEDREEASSAPSIAPSDSEGSRSEEPTVPEAAAGTQESAVGHLTFRGETVIDIYTLHTHRHTTRRYPGLDAYPGFDEDRMMELLEQMPQDTEPTANAWWSFIIFTEIGRHYVYIDSDQTPRELIDLWETIALTGEKVYNIHWLTHMTTSKITEIRAGMAEAEVQVTDRASIEKIADFLKHDLTVDGGVSIGIHEGAINPVTVMGLYQISISFDSGVSYLLTGYGDYVGIDEGGSVLEIYTSDLDTTIVYRLTEGCAAQMRSFFAENF